MIDNTSVVNKLDGLLGNEERKELKLKENVLSYARLYLEKGLNVIPINIGEKTPRVRWKKYMDQRVSEEQIEKWFMKNDKNIAIICGAISGNLVVIDFDNQELYDKFIEKLNNGYPDIKDIILSTWIVRTGKGYHIYLRIGDVSSEDFKAKFRTTKLGGIDIKGEGGYVLAPPSIHPSGRYYEFILGRAETDIATVDSKTFSTIVEILKDVAGIKKGIEKPIEKEKKEAPSEKPREVKIRRLSDSEKLRIIELLKEVYREGHRQDIWFFLSGWMAYANIDPLDCLDILLKLYKDTGDSDPLEQRVSALVYSYKKLYQLRGYGIDIDQYGDKIIELTGVKPYGLYETLSEEYLKKGVGGKHKFFSDVLIKALGSEEKALYIQKELEDILKVASPFKDVIIAPLHYEKKLFAVANQRANITVIARLTEDKKLVYIAPVFRGAPRNVVVWRSPLDPIPRYTMIWDTGEKATTVEIKEPMDVEDVLAMLSHVTVNSRYAKDVLVALLNASLEKGYAEVKYEIFEKGFYWIDNKLIAVGVNVEKPSVEEVREALQLLEELRNWYDPVKLSTLIKWGVVAPFSYARKQIGRELAIPDMALEGARDTGKSTLGAIAGYFLWGREIRKITKEASADIEYYGGSVSTEYRYGEAVSKTTFPILINECNEIFNDRMINIIKGKVESTIVRSRYERGRMKNYLALSSVIYTLNPSPRVDWGKYELVPKTILRMEFTSAEVKSNEQKRQFNKEMLPKLPKLGAIGRYVASYMLENPELIKTPNWLDLAEKLLEELYRYAGMEFPEWLKTFYEPKPIEESIEEKRIEFIQALKRNILDHYTRYISRVHVHKDGRDQILELVPIEDRIKIALEEQILPYVIKADSDRYLITSKILHEKDFENLQITSLRDLAEILGIPDKYVPRRKIKIGGKETTYSVIELTLEEFLGLLKVEEAI